MQALIEMLGTKCRDKVTGFTGIVSTVSFDLYGCVQAVLTPPVKKDGTKESGEWFDINRLEVLKKARVMPVPSFGKNPSPGKPPEYGPAEKPPGKW